MSHLDEVIARVDAAIEESVIAHMNELLIALSDDAELSREDRYTLQQRLRTAIAHHGRKHKEDMEARHEQLTKGGIHPLIKMSVWPPAARPTTSKIAPQIGPINARSGTPWLRKISSTRPPISWLATSTAIVVAAPTF